MKKILLLLFILSFTNAFSQGKKTTLSKQKPVEITPEIDYCSQILNGHGSNKNILASTPNVDGIVIARKITETDTSFYLSVETTANTKVDDQTGLELLFPQKTIKYKDTPVEIKANAIGDDMYRYSTFVKLPWLDLFDIMVYDLKIIQIYVFDRKLKEGSSFLLKKYAGCFIDKKP